MAKDVFIDKGFRPSILPFIPKEKQSQLDRWEMDHLGTPVTTQIKGSKAAVWVGSFNERHEAPVILAITEERQTLKYDATWLGGIALESVVRESENPVEACADAALHTGLSAEKTIILVQTLMADNPRRLLPI